MGKNTHLPTDERKEDWETPEWLFQKLNNIFRFAGDLCASEHNNLAPFFITKEQDIFSQETCSRFRAVGPWTFTGEMFFINPPYKLNGRTGPFLSRAAFLASQVDAGVVGLIPAALDTEWWREHVFPFYEYFVFPKRFSFVEPGGDRYTTPKGRAQFGCAVVIRLPGGGASLSPPRLGELLEIGPVLTSPTAVNGGFQ